MQGMNLIDRALVMAARNVDLITKYVPHIKMREVWDVWLVIVGYWMKHIALLFKEGFFTHF